MALSPAISAGFDRFFQLCYNQEVAPKWRYRLGVRTEDSQSSNPGSIPGSATKFLFSSATASSILNIGLVTLVR